MRVSILPPVAAVLAAAVSLAPSAARAQSAARVSEVERVVKAGRAGTSALVDAKVGTALAVGDSLRTGGRSAAGIRFTDESGLRIGELTQIVLSGVRRKDARLLRGRVVADFRTPGTIRSGSAIAAVRGTRVDVEEEDGETSIHCYHGRVFVAGAGSPIAAGTSPTVTPTTLTDPVLQEASEDFTGGQIRFVDGPYNGQSRGITAFNRGAGTVTFAPALAPAAGAQGPSGYLLLQRADTPVVELGNRTGTRVRAGQPPEAPHRVPGGEFARLERYPFTAAMRDGRTVYTYPGTAAFDHERDATLAERQGIGIAVRRPRPRVCCPPGRGNERSPGHLHHALGRAFRQSVGAAGAAAAPAAVPEFRYQPVETPLDGDETSRFRLEPFGFASDETDAAGARVRYQAVTGSVYLELGYFYARTGERDRHEVSEGFLHVRGRRGDVIAGRQHLFLGPANNTDIGTLLGLESTDAVVLRTPPASRFDQTVGYVWDSRALGRSRFAGGFARGRTAAGPGIVGYSLLVDREDGRNIGFQGDAAVPVVRNTLDVYGEIGKGVRGRELYTGGFYVPELYHRYRLDLFAEYALREDRDERVTLRLRRQFGNGLLLIAFLEQELGTSFFAAGGGVLWNLRFR